MAAPKKIQRTLPVTVPKTMQPQTAVQTALDELEMSALSANTSITKITLDRTYIKLAAGESDRLTATVFPVTSTEKLTWNCDFFGGINVYQDGRIFITEDTPVGTTATITVFPEKYPRPVRLLWFRDRVNTSGETGQLLKIRNVRKRDCVVPFVQSVRKYGKSLWLRPDTAGLAKQ